MYRNSTLIVTAVIAVISLSFQASAQTETANLTRAGSCSDQIEELRQAAIRNRRQAPPEAEWNVQSYAQLMFDSDLTLAEAQAAEGNIDECLLSVGRAKDEFQKQPVYSSNKE